MSNGDFNKVAKQSHVVALSNSINCNIQPVYSLICNPLVKQKHFYLFFRLQTSNEIIPIMWLHTANKLCGTGTSQNKLSCLGKKTFHWNNSQNINLHSSQWHDSKCEKWEKEIDFADRLLCCTLIHLVTNNLSLGVLDKLNFCYNDRTKKPHPRHRHIYVTCKHEKKPFRGVCCTGNYFY